MVSTFTYASRSPDFDFVELLTYSKDTGVVMVGKMTEHETVKKLNKYKLARAPCVNAIGKFWKPWFFKYVESYLANGVAGGSDKNESAENFKKLEYLSQLYSSPLHFYSPNAESKQLLPPMRATELEQDLIPLRDYYHRHTKAIFWELQDIIPFGNEPWFRYTLGWAVPPQVSMLKLTTTEKIREIYSKAHVIQVCVYNNWKVV
jgi:delta24-sterol reductase